MSFVNFPWNSKLDEVLDMNIPNNKKLIQRDYIKAILKPNNSVKLYMDENNIHDWYILFHNLLSEEDELKDGEYLFMIRAMSTFPASPPIFIAITPNGVFEPLKRPCISIGEYHKERWVPALGMSGFIDSLMSTLVSWRCLGEGININKTTPEEKKQFAIKSKEFNYQKYPELMQKINESYDNYSKRWKK